ncbi:MAG: hypothetical protein VKM17_09665 [Cyanobacteriota bacterium]|nr:hypothetical protein [Cyanobacteriota bacterium]
MKFSKVVFYGRLGEQALKMFGLEGELPRWRTARLLDCPGGPGSLPALLRSHGLDVTAVDPLYALPPARSSAQTSTCRPAGRSISKPWSSFSPTGRRTPSATGRERCRSCPSPMATSISC